MFRCLLIALTLALLPDKSYGQQQKEHVLNFVKSEVKTPPGKVVNLAFQIKNETADTIWVLPNFIYPEGWSLITRPSEMRLMPGDNSLGIVSVKAAQNNRVGKFPFQAQLLNKKDGAKLASATVEIEVLEVENVTLQLLDNPGHVNAGESITATYLVQNLGNTEKKLFINTSNCDVVGSPDLKLQPGESTRIQIEKVTLDNALESKKESYTVRAQVNDRILESVYSSTIVLPSQKAKRDLYFRFPIKASATYLSTNQNGKYESGHQFLIEGRGALDQAGKHELGFLARWPNNADLNFMGLYDEYSIYYKQKNLNVFLGEKSYMLTPLTESSRFGKGAEAKVTLNSVLEFGMFYIEPRFYEEIENEIAAFTGFQFNKKNKIGLYYLSKKFLAIEEPAQLASFTTTLSPLSRTVVDLEFSRGKYNGNSSNAIRTGLNSQFSIFQVSGLYYNAGQYYPGYYTNTKFYSANVNAHLSKKLSLTFYTREDFNNAQLDSFFVIAPYSRSLQGAVRYRIGNDGNVKIYWREYERKDRSVEQRFHYVTDSWNLQFSQRLKRIYYDIFGEMGETTNYLRASGENKQNSYRAGLNLNYRFNSNNSLRVFGNWSNINQFVSDDRRSVMAGLSASSRISKNLRLNFYLQNAYDIDDYYRNRNLMQFNVDYSFLKRHEISLRSFYTLFRNEVDEPEFSASLTYSYNLGIPLKKVVKSGTIAGRITNQEGEAVEGIYVQVLSETAVSDKNGEFEFKSLPPGKQLLVIDRGRMKIDEISSVPMPVEIEVVEDEETAVNIQIQKGARMQGHLKLGQAGFSVLENDNTKLSNIVIELKTEFESYRISTNKDGYFEFPLVRPGEVVLRIYPNTIPVGYGSEKSNYVYRLSPGEQRELEITLVSKKKNIIFKPSGTKLSVKNGLTPLTVTKVQKSENTDVSRKPYYTVQIGAFRRPLTKDSEFLKGHAFYFEKQIDNLHKYFVGKYESFEKASTELARLRERYKHAFLVVVKNDRIINAAEFRKIEEE